MVSLTVDVGAVIHLGSASWTSTGVLTAEAVPSEVSSEALVTSAWNSGVEILAWIASGSYVSIV